MPKKPRAPAPKSQAAWLSVLGEPTRLALIRALVAGPKTVTKLAIEVGTEAINVTHHLGMLRDEDLVTFEKNGRFMIYSLVGATVAKGMLELVHPSGAKVTLPLE